MPASTATLRTFAKRMRHEPVFTERLLWKLLRDRRLGGLKFRRQVPLGPYIADFVCFERRLIVELDGPTHDALEGRAADALRDAVLRGFGYRVLRFRNDDVLEDRAAVFRAILRAAGVPDAD